MNIKSIIAYLLSYIVVPISCLEVAAELRLNGQLPASNSPFSRLVRPFISNGRHIESLNRPLIKQTHYYKDLYLGSKEFNPVIFETDAYGSSLENSLERFSDRAGKVLFCGGSTLESGSIPARFRPVHVASLLGGKSSTQLPYINLSKSGNNLLDCINILKSKQIKELAPSPSKIVIATNVNTVGAAVVSLASGSSDLGAAKELILNQYHSKSIIQKIKHVIEHTFPGIAEVYRRVLKNEFNSSDIKVKTLHPHEVSLRSGCCHISALVNNRKELSWDWESEESLHLWNALITRYFGWLARVVDDLGVDRKDVYIYIEPNSFSMIQSRNTNILFTRNQELRSLKGVHHAGSSSHRITSRYDKIYSDNASQLGFTIIESPYARLKAEHFFDSVHLTPLGGKLVGKYLYESIN